MPVSTQSSPRHREAVLTTGAIGYYRRLFARLTQRMSRATTVRSDIECMRMCVDAVDRPAGTKRDAA